VLGHTPKNDTLVLCDGDAENARNENAGNKILLSVVLSAERTSLSC